jgi:NodT family efflux transporter outer membrane factor (OMF) lipoprotein
MRSFATPFRGLALALAASTALTACASVPDLGAAPTVKPVTDYATAQSFTATAADWPADAWWTAYGDAQLNGLIEEALAGSPSMVAAQARLTKAQALAQQAGAALKPTLSGSAAVNGAVLELDNLSPDMPSGLQGNAYGTLSARFDLDLWGRSKAALAAATSDAEAARADQAQARLTLSTSVAAAYADLVQLYANLDAANEAVAVRRQTSDLIGKRFTNGLDNRGGLDQADAGRAQAEGDIAAIDETIGLTRNRIAALLGAGPDRGLSIQRPANAKVKAFGLPAQIQAELLGRRPDVVAARLRAEAGADRTRSAKAAFYPNVNLSGTLLGLIPDLGALSGSAVGVAAFGPAISLPIFDGGRLDGQYRGARADHIAAVADYDRAVTQALRDVADVTVSQKALANRLAKSREALASAQAAHKIARDRYTGGLSTYLEVLRAEDALIANRRAVADLETRAFVLDIALVRALGGGFQADQA